MPMTSPDRIVLTDTQRGELDRLVRAGRTAQRLAQRAGIVLAAAEGQPNARIATSLGICEDTAANGDTAGVSSLGDAKRIGCHCATSAAHVHPALIGRYIGGRDDLIRAVFDDLSAQLASAVLAHPLSGQGFGPDTVMGKWTRLAGALAIAGQPPLGRDRFNPVLAMAKTLEDGYGLDPEAARLRAAQIVAMALGWRIFENFLIDAGELDMVGLGGAGRAQFQDH